MEREFEIITNYIDTLIVYEDDATSKKAINKVDKTLFPYYKFEDGECEIEFEFYDGLAIATDGSGLFMTYSKMDCIKESPRKQREICDYNGIEDSINQYDVALRYGKLDCNAENFGYIKKTAKQNNWIVETYIMIAADIFNDIYNCSDSSYTETAEIIRLLAEKFEKELDWQGDNEKRDYIFELEKFEEREIERIKKKLDK